MYSLKGVELIMFGFSTGGTRTRALGISEMYTHSIVTSQPIRRTSEALSRCLASKQRQKRSSTPSSYIKRTVRAPPSFRTAYTDFSTLLQRLYGRLLLHLLRSLRA